MPEWKRVVRVTHWLAVTAMMLHGTAAFAQAKNAEALGLVRDAMDAFSNLNLDKAKADFDKALALSSQVDKDTLSRIYINSGVLAIGGFSDNAAGQKHFQIALCLAPSALVDPIYSTPEVDLIFGMARNQMASINCPGLFKEEGIALEKKPDSPIVKSRESKRGIEPCGEYQPFGEQKQKYEVPFYLEPTTGKRSSLRKLALFYAFDAAVDYKKLDLQQKGIGYGTLLSCDVGQIRIYDPRTVAYYIEGYDASGQLICGHGTKAAPIEIVMSPEAPPLPPVAGMLGKECAPCPPWDESCGKVVLPGLGEPCQVDKGCDAGLRCSEVGLCEEDEDSQDASTGQRTPRRFYVNLSIGTGFGYVKDTVNLKKPNTTATTGWDGRLINVDQATAGTAWTGLPLRLGVGVHILPSFSLEITARFNLFITKTKSYKTCAEAAAESGLPATDLACGPTWEKEPSEDDVPARERSAVDGSNPIRPTSLDIDWLVNLRARYRFLEQGGLVLSGFLGAGYGHIKYRVPATDSPDIYYPMPGMVNVELGLGLAYYFNRHVGIFAEVPIDLVVGDGLGLNFELAAGLSFGL